MFDATAQNNPHVRNNDFGIRNANGFMFEVMRNLGFYIQFGETLGFVRWLRFEIDARRGCASSNSVIVRARNRNLRSSKKLTLLSRLE